MENSREARLWKSSFGRWFGVVRRKNGKFYYGFDWVKDCPTQQEFVHDKLKPESGDDVIEIFKNMSLEPDDFISYYKEFYLQEAPIITQLVRV